MHACSCAAASRLPAPCPAPGFLLYVAAALASTLYLIFRVPPEVQTSNILVYVAICSIVGSLSGGWCAHAMGCCWVRGWGAHERGRCWVGVSMERERCIVGADAGRQAVDAGVLEGHALAVSSSRRLDAPRVTCASTLPSPWQ